MKIIAEFINKVTEIIFPNNCILCNKIISSQDLLCKDDALKLEYILDPKCKICSNPLPKADESDRQNLICTPCIIKKPAFSQTLTIFYYNQPLKKIIANFKYHDQSYLAKNLGFLLYQKAKDHLDKIDIITITPLHKNRLRQRKFNQSILLAKWLIKHAKKDLTKANYQKLIKKFIPDLLIKIKDTKSQVHLSRKDRKQNLSRAFLLKQKYSDVIKAKKILLIDDIVTTGTTLQKCAFELKKNRALEVITLTIAKSVKDKV